MEMTYARAVIQAIKSSLIISLSRGCPLYLTLYLIFLSLLLNFSKLFRRLYGNLPKICKCARAYALIRIDSLSFYVNLFDWTHIAVLGEIASRKDYEKLFAPRQGNVVVDVGAHIGTFSLRAATLVDEMGKVIAFEPNPESLFLLNPNITVNKATNIFPINCALGRDNKPRKLMIPNLESGGARLTTAYAMESIAVNIISLDTFLANKFPRVDFLKIDVEGSEMEVLEGAEKTVEKNKMRIVVEVHSRNLLSEITNYLRNKGYKTLSINYPYFHNFYYLFASNKFEDSECLEARIWKTPHRFSR